MADAVLFGRVDLAEGPGHSSFDEHRVVAEPPVAARRPGEGAVATAFEAFDRFIGPGKRQHADEVGVAAGVRTNSLDFASVTITGPTNRTLRTDATGFYGAADLSPGSYVLTASFPGLVNVSTTNIVSAGAVTTVDLQLPLPTPPQVVTPPLAMNIAVGSNATFTVTASGTSPLFYQWLFQGNPVAGATNTTLTLTSAQLASAGGYSVVVSNIAGTNQSTTAALFVVPRPVIQSIRFVDETQVALTWSSTPGFRYRVEATGDANGGSWVEASGLLEALQSSMSANVAVNSGTRFFQIVCLPPTSP